MPSPDLDLAEKDTTKSCIFAFPDRPVETLPPNYPPGTPPDLYPYDPIDDWPLDPPPVPGSNPHPVTPTPDPDFPPVSPVPFFYQIQLWYASNGSGLRLSHGDPPWAANLGVDANIIASIDGSKEFVPRTICAPILLEETGFDFDYTTDLYESGLLIYGAFLDPQWVVYVSYFLRFFQAPDTDVIVFAPCPLSGPGQLPECQVTDHANFFVSPTWYLGPGITPVEKTFLTGAIKISNGLVTVPLGFIAIG